MNDALLYALVTLAVYRVSHMIAGEDGPFLVFAKLRGALYERFAHIARWSWLYEGAACVLCLSFWFSFIGALITPGLFLLDWLGIAGAALIIHKVAYR